MFGLDRSTEHGTVLTTTVSDDVGICAILVGRFVLGVYVLAGSDAAVSTAVSEGRRSSGPGFGWLVRGEDRLPGGEAAEMTAVFETSRRYIGRSANSVATSSVTNEDGCRFFPSKSLSNVVR